MKAAILGGGVAGVSTAIALKKIGFDVTVFERRKSPSNIGAGIVLWPNAVYVLTQLGVFPEIEAVSGLPTRMHRRSNNNEGLGSINIETINRHMGYPSLSILRSDFQAILLSKFKSLEVSIQYDHTVKNIETGEAGQTEVYFENGSKITADIIIGADGRMGSCARRYVHGNNTPVFQGFINWVGVYESGEEVFDDITVTDYWGVGERFGIVPINKHKAYWAGGVACANVGSTSLSGYKNDLTQTFSNWPDPIPLMINRTPVERINKVYVHDHHPIPVWHKHNVILIGDAAHASLPTSGQGACQALEDAWHLANCLKENPDNLQKAFSIFTNIRLEKTSNITKAGRSFASSLFNRDDEFCRLRNDNSKRSDLDGVALGMSQFWGQHLPLKE